MENSALVLTCSTDKVTFSIIYENLYIWTSDGFVLSRVY
jgi:hypothetical protein